MSELKKYRVLRPIGESGRIEAGEIVSYDDETASKFALGFLEPVIETAPAVAPTDSGTAGDQTAGTDTGSGTSNASDQTGNEEPKLRYKVINVTEINGVSVGAGEIIELTAAQAATFPAGTFEGDANLPPV